MARAYCLKKGADLVSLTTNDEVNFVYSHTKNLDYWFWIGLRYNRTKLRKNAHWAWSNGDKLNITKWNTGEPNNLVTEHCVEILKGMKVWNNQQCTTRLAWICEKPKSVNTSRKSTVKKIPVTAPSKPTTTTKIRNAKPSIITSTKVVPMTTRKSTEENTKPTKDQSSDTNSSTMSISMALYIFQPMILLALIIVIILLVRKNTASNEKESPREENNREMENQENNIQTFTESDGYTELHHNREPDNTYSSLNLYENPDDNSDPSYVTSGRSYVIGNNINYINQEAQRRSSYVIPPASDTYEIPDYR